MEGRTPEYGEKGPEQEPVHRTSFTHKIRHNGVYVDAEVRRVQVKVWAVQWGHSYMPVTLGVLSEQAIAARLLTEATNMRGLEMDQVEAGMLARSILLYEMLSDISLSSTV